MPLRASDVAFGNDVYCVNDVTPDGVVGKHHIIANIGSNIIMSKANNITYAQAKTSLVYHPKVKRKYNTLHLAGKKVCKKDEERRTSHKEVSKLYCRDRRPRLSVREKIDPQKAKRYPRQIVKVCRGCLLLYNAFGKAHTHRDTSANP